MKETEREGEVLYHFEALCLCGDVFQKCPTIVVVLSMYSPMSNGSRFEYVRFGSSLAFTCVGSSLYLVL